MILVLTLLLGLMAIWAHFEATLSSRLSDTLEPNVHFWAKSCNGGQNRASILLGNDASRMYGFLVNDKLYSFV